MCCGLLCGAVWAVPLRSHSTSVVFLIMASLFVRRAARGVATAATATTSRLSSVRGSPIIAARAVAAACAWPTTPTRHMTVEADSHDDFKPKVKKAAASEDEVRAFIEKVGV